MEEELLAMCAICDAAAAELGAFVKQLEDKYPGTIIGNQIVPRNHYVATALTHAAFSENERYANDLWLLEQNTKGIH
jgi:hypothetical protein